MKITAQQFISNSKEKGTFVTILKHYSAESTPKTEKEGDIYCLLSIFGNTSLPAERVSKFVWDGILDGYIYSTSKSTNESLKEGITEGVKKLKSLMKNDKSLEDLGVNVNFVLIAQKKEGLYIGNLGENEVFVFKDGKFVNITEILGKSKASTAGVALKEGDVLVVSTVGVVSKNFEKLEKTENTEKVINVLKEVGESLSGNQGLVFFTYGEDEPLTPVKESKLPSPVVLPKIPELPLQKMNVKIPKIPINIMGLKKVANSLKPTYMLVKVEIGKAAKWLQRKLSVMVEKISSRSAGMVGKKRWYKRMASKVSEVKINQPDFRGRGIRIDGYRTKNIRAKRLRLVFLIVLGIVLLALGINFTIKTREANAIHNQATQIFTNAENLIKKAESMSTSDRSSAETEIYQAQSALKGVPENISEKDLAIKSELEARILTVEDFLYKRTGLTDNDGKISTFIDSRLAFGDGSNPTDMEIYMDKAGNEYLLLTDKGLNAVFRVSLYDKTSKRLTDSSGLLKDPEYISMGNSGVFVFDNKTGVVKAPYDNDKWFSPFVQLSGLSRDNIKSKDIGEFIVLTEIDNIYLLARDEKAVLKSVFSYENRYGLYYKYISDDRFANATEILSDLSIYVLTKDDPKLIRYSYNYVEQKQVENPLTISGVNGDLGDLTKGYTTGSLDGGLYVFDQTLKRFIKFEKPQEGGGAYYIQMK